MYLPLIKNCRLRSGEISKRKKKCLPIKNIDIIKNKKNFLVNSEFGY